MAAFLKIVSGVYLAFVWLAFFLALSAPQLPSSYGPLGSGNAGVHVLMFLIAVGLSIPAVALFAFGQVVGDVRITRNYARTQAEHLQAMRRYYEPEQRQRSV